VAPYLGWNAVGRSASPRSASPPRKWLQTALNVLGANPALDVDGECGPMTKNAVSQFRMEHGLVVDGWAEPTRTFSLRSPKLSEHKAITLHLH
jgi:peptidoglycan hydrolase-like protein with peptidoglycan-binding domain